MGTADHLTLLRLFSFLQYVFFSNATLHDGTTQPTGCQTTSRMAHFIVIKCAFYDLSSLGLFFKNLTLFSYWEISAKICKKNFFLFLL